MVIGTLYGNMILMNLPKHKKSILGESEWGMCFKVQIFEQKYAIGGFLEGKIKIVDKESMILWKELKFKNVVFEALNPLLINTSALEFIFTVKEDPESDQNNEKVEENQYKKNFIYTKKFGYFKDSESINPVNGAIRSSVVQLQSLEDHPDLYIFLTTSELYCVHKKDKTSSYKDEAIEIDAYMGLIEDRNLKVNPMFQLQNLTSKASRRTPADDITVLKQILVLSGGQINLYFLIKEADGLLYFRPQRSFQNLPGNVVAFRAINKLNLILLTSDFDCLTMFCDVDSSTNFVSTFKPVRLPETLTSLLLIKDVDKTLRADYTNSFKLLKTSNRVLFLGKKIGQIQLLGLSATIDHLEGEHEWSLAFSLLEKIYKLEEQRLVFLQNTISDFTLKSAKNGGDGVGRLSRKQAMRRKNEQNREAALSHFNDLVDSYLDYCVGNARTSPHQWIECLYLVSYFSKQFDRQTEVLIKVKEKSIENRLIDIYFGCLSNLVKERVVEALHEEELKIVIEYFKLKNEPEVLSGMLLALEFKDDEKDVVVSVCYDLGLMEPLIKIFLGNQTKPDYFSCLNLLYRRYQQFGGEEVLGSLVLVLENCVEKISSGFYRSEKLKVQVLDQVMLWIMDDLILSFLILSEYRVIFRVLERFFRQEIYSVLKSTKTSIFGKVENVYEYPKHMYEKIKTVSFKAARVGGEEVDDQAILQNFLYFSLKLSLKPRVHFATSDVILFLSQLSINEFELFDGVDEIEAVLADVVSRYRKNMTNVDIRSLLEAACANNM